MGKDASDYCQACGDEGEVELIELLLYPCLFLFIVKTSLVGRTKGNVEFLDITRRKKSNSAIYYFTSTMIVKWPS